MMCSNFPSRETVERIRRHFPVGCRVELIRMSDPFTNLKPGDRGTVVWVDDIGSLHCEWDNGSTLGVVYGEDYAKKIDP